MWWCFVRGNWMYLHRQILPSQGLPRSIRSECLNWLSCMVQWGLGGLWSEELYVSLGLVSAEHICTQAWHRMTALTLPDQTAGHSGLILFLWCMVPHIHLLYLRSQYISAFSHHINMHDVFLRAFSMYIHKPCFCVL